MAGYRDRVRELEASFESKENPRYEGHSGENVPQQKFYRSLGRQPFVSTICEIGFNAGHYALNWLSAKPGNKLISFDLGWHSYTRPHADFLKRTFPGQMFNIFGNSTLTVPAFHRMHPDVNCDVLVVDGGHSFKDAAIDIGNMMFLANRFFNVMIMDDINCEGRVLHSQLFGSCTGPEQAIEFHQTRGNIRMLEMFNVEMGRGIGLGEYKLS